MKSIFENISIDKVVNSIDEIEENKSDIMGVDKKLTPAQKRDALYKKISSFIENNEVDEVNKLLKNNPKLDFVAQVNSLSDLREVMLKNFNNEIYDALKSRGFFIRPYMIYSELIQGDKNINLFKFLCTSYKNGEIDKRTVNDIFGNFLKMHYVDTTKKEREKYKEYRKTAIELGIVENLSSYINLGHSNLHQNIAFNYKEISQELIEDVNPIKMERIKIFAENLTLKTSISGAEFLKFEKFLSRFPEIKKEIECIYNENKKNNEKIKNQVEKEIEDDKQLLDTEFIEKIIKSHSKATSYSYSYSYSHTQNAAAKFVNQSKEVKQSIKEMMTELGVKDELGFSAREQILSLGGFHLMKINYYYSTALSEYDIYDGKYRPESMLENVILNPNTQEDIYTALLDDEKARQLIYDKLTSNIYIRARWCRKIPAHLLSKTIKNIDMLKEWKDDRGNNLGHYLISFRKSLPKTYLQAILRTNKAWFNETNNKGFELMDIIKPNSDKSALVWIEKNLMQKELKEAGLIKRKTKSSKKNRVM